MGRAPYHALATGDDLAVSPTRERLGAASARARRGAPRLTDLSGSRLGDATSAADMRYAWRVFSVTTLGVILTAVNSSTLDVALPAVSRHFNATPSEASWILLSYMLVTTVLILAFGRLADLLGRRLLYIAGLLVFTIASLGCAFSPNAGALIALRALQAVGAASVVTNTTALLVDAFPPRMLGLGLGMNVTAISASQVAGPLVGGALVTWLGWRSVFLFNVPTGLIGVGWGLIVLRRMPRPPQRERFDVLSSVVSLFALGGVVVVLSEGGAREWTDPLVLAAGAVAVVGLPLFGWMQRVRREPLIDLSLLLTRMRAATYFCSLAANAARFAVVLVVSLFLQAADGLNAFEAGWRVMPTAFGMMLTSPLSGRLIARYGAPRLARLGLALCALAVLLLALTLAPSAPVLEVCGELLLLGVGSGMFLPANTASIMSGVPMRRRGVANGIRSTLQNTGTVVGTAMSLALATTLLGPREKQAAYAGTLGRLDGGDLWRFVDGCRMALYALFAVCLVALAVATPRQPSAADGGDGAGDAR